MSTPTDQPARHAIATSLDETMFVEAGAGSGKTKSLVDRFVALVESGIPADRIAAITFTEKAAGELSDRVRGRLESVAPHALADLDKAAICTLHAFAQRILTLHPIEAGLPPRVTVLDEIASQLAFEARWERFVDRIIEDPELERPLRMLLAVGATLDQLHEVASKFGQSWDLVAERVTEQRTTVPPLDLTELDDALAALAALARLGPIDDGLTTRCVAIAAWGERVRRAPDDDARLELLKAEKHWKAGSAGQKNAWGGRKDEVIEAIAVVKSACVVARNGVELTALGRILEELAQFTVDSARERQAAGELEFHDLLVLARQVLRDPEHGWPVRESLRDRYQRLLLDEFQDTDPIQVELAVLLGSSDQDAASKDWWDVAVDPGRLFFVGDPKQSIYRFRRADIAVFLRARDRVGGRVEQLTTNFRTVEPILRWVNHAFGQLIQGAGESQPDYVPLDDHRQPDAGSTAPHVAFVGVEHHLRDSYIYADELRESEADDVARAIREAYADGWTVYDEQTKAWRPTTWRDIAILLPARTSLRLLERALDAHGVPYRAETSSLVYGTREVRDLLMIARAVEDPTDGLAVVAALRTPAFGCGDDDLFEWKKVHGGAWDHQRPFRDDAPREHPVAQGLAWLGDLHRERHWLSPSQVLDRIVRDRRLLEVAYVHPRPRDLWRRMRFVVDQCRAWEEAGGGTLRDYLRWVKLQSAEGSRVVETVLPETDDEAVRIMTVHGAKGLEFPITVLSGMTTELSRRRSGVQVLFPDGDRWAVKLKSDLQTEDFELTQPLEEQMDLHERLRLLYVAATRARDHLIVSVHRRPKDVNTAAALFHQAGWVPDLVEPLAFLDEPAASPTTGQAFDPDAVTIPPFAEWQSELDAARAEASRPVAISATKLAELAEAERLAGLQKEPRDIDLPPWQKGRYGSAIGRAVHGVMQSVDLAADSPPDDLVAAQAAAEGVEGHEETIKRLCTNALASDVVKRAATRRHWREVYVGVPDDEYGVLEGYIDLLYEDEDGLVIVDYKTDAFASPEELDDKVERYAVQLSAYADAVTTATSAPVVRSELVFAAGPITRLVG